MSDYTAKDFLHMARLRQVALKEIATRLGKDHPITIMMGSSAWGRSRFETGPQPKLRDCIEAKAGLDGKFDVLNTWARDNDPKAQQTLLAIYPQGYTKSK